MPTSRSGSSESRLPASPSFALLRDLAKGLLKAHKAGREEAVSRFLQHHPRFKNTTSGSVAGAEISLRDAQLVVAREHVRAQEAARMRMPARMGIIVFVGRGSYGAHSLIL